MKYYAVPISMMKGHGLGDEHWRKRKGDDVLVNESEIIERLRYQDSEAFEQETGITPMTLKEAKEWNKNK